MGWKISVITILFLLVIAYLGISAFIAYKLTIPNDSPVNFDKSLIGRGTEVSFMSKDKLQLTGWYFPGNNDRAIMFVHGAGNQNRVNEIYGTPEIAKYFIDKGYTVLLFDLRGTGQSTKTRLSFGQYESIDVASAFEYLVKQEFKPQSIGIISNSLGAIATIMAADDLQNAGGIVLDSPAEVVRPIVSHIMEDEHNIPNFVHPAAFFWAKVLYKIDVDAVRPIDKIQSLSQTPLLFIHGEKDTLIPPQNSEELLSKVTNGKRITFPNAEHILTYKSDKTRYLEEVSDFFDDNLD